MFLHADGTMRSVVFAAIRPSSFLTDQVVFSRAYCHAFVVVPATAASIVKDFPNPMSSASIPPSASGALGLLAPVIM